MAPGSMSSTLLALTMTSTPWRGASGHQGPGSVPWQHHPLPQHHPPGRTRRSWPRGWRRHTSGRLAHPRPPVVAGEKQQGDPSPIDHHGAAGLRDTRMAGVLPHAQPCPCQRCSPGGHGLPSPQHGLPTHPIDEDIFGEHGLGVLDAAEAIHHLLDLKVAGELQQTSTWHGTISPRPPSTRMGAGENAGRAKPAAGTGDLTSRRCQFQVIGAILVRVEGPGETVWVRRVPGEAWDAPSSPSC